MSSSHQELREAIGAYVLGQLAADHPLGAELEEHLRTCTACQAEVEELTPLRVALDRVDPMSLTGLGQDRPVPVELDRRVDRALAAEADRRDSARGRAVAFGWRGAVAAGLLGAAAATALFVALPDDEAAPAGPVVLAARDVQSSSGVVADVGLVDHTWGVELKMRLTGLPGGLAYDVHVIDTAGRTFDSGAFLGVKGRTITCSMNSSVLLAQATRFEVTAPDGHVVVSGAMPS